MHRRRARAVTLVLAPLAVGALVACSHEQAASKTPVQPISTGTVSTRPMATVPAPHPAPAPSGAPARSPIQVAMPAPAASPQAATDPRAYVAQAQAELQAGSNDVAIETAKQALQLDARNADAMVVIAQAEYNEGKVDLARYALDQALAIDPADADANNLYGFIDQTRQDLASDSDRIAAAQKHFQAATQANPDFAAAWNNLGAMLLKQKDYQQADQALQNAVRIRPNWAVAQMNLGSAMRGEALHSGADPSQREPLLQQAEQRYEQAGRLDPNNPDIHFNLGILYLDADPFPGLQTIDRLQKAIDELTRYQQMMGPRLAADDPTQAPDGGYLADAKAQYAHEQRELEKKRRKAERQQQQGGGSNGG